MLRNITIRSWLRYLSPKIANFVLLKLDFWTRQCKEMNSLLIILSCINYYIIIISLNFLVFAII